MRPMVLLVCWLVLPGGPILGAEPDTLVGGRLIHGCSGPPLEDSVILFELGGSGMDVIRAASYWSTVPVEGEEDVGIIAAGKLAHVIAVRGNVLTYIDQALGRRHHCRARRPVRVTRQDS